MQKEVAGFQVYIRLAVTGEEQEGVIKDECQDQVEEPGGWGYHSPVDLGKTQGKDLWRSVP